VPERAAPEGLRRRTLSFDPRRIGLWTPDKEFRVRASRIAAYARAIGDTEPRHIAGEIAPPLFAVVPTAEAIVEAERAVTPLYDQYVGLHGEQDIVFHRPILPETTVRSRAAAVGVRSVSSGVLLLLRTETRDESGALLNEQYSTSFYREQEFEQELGERAPEHRLPESVATREPLARVQYGVAADQTVRYAEASGDRGAYHLDDEFARSVGLPGIILHGLCAMALTSRALVETACAGDSTRLARLAVRFSRPVRPGQQLTTVIWEAGVQDGRGVYLFEANADGETVIQHGRAEVVA
jgi:acyl dehydratase